MCFTLVSGKTIHTVHRNAALFPLVCSGSGGVAITWTIKPACTQCSKNTGPVLPCTSANLKLWRESGVCYVKRKRGGDGENIRANPHWASLKGKSPDSLIIRGKKYVVYFQGRCKCFWSLIGYVCFPVGLFFFSTSYSAVTMETESERISKEMALSFSLHIFLSSFSLLVTVAVCSLSPLVVTQVLSSNSGLFLSPQFGSLCDKMCS